MTQAIHPTASGLPGTTETFSYDAVGNRLADAQLTGYAYNAANRMSANSGFTSSYDPDGNIVTQTDTLTSGATTFGYESEDRLIGVTRPDSESWTYKYDGSGRRVEKSSGSASSQLIQYVYDARNILAVLDGNNTPEQIFTMRLAVDGPLSQRSGAGTELFFAQDGLGSVQVLTDSGANIVEKYEYQGFGKPFIKDSSGNEISVLAARSRLMFAAVEYDRETGHYNNRFRQLDPTIGRFNSEDPSGIAGGINLYVYALNRPLNNTDPLGLSPADVERIREIFEDTLNRMVDSGERFPGRGKMSGSANNILSNLQGALNTKSPYRQCLAQSQLVNRALNAKAGSLEAKWTFQEILFKGHSTVVALSSDPSDVAIVLDPLYGRFYTESSAK